MPFIINELERLIDLYLKNKHHLWKNITSRKISQHLRYTIRLLLTKFPKGTEKHDRGNGERCR